MQIQNGSHLPLCILSGNPLSLQALSLLLFLTPFENRNEIIYKITTKRIERKNAVL